MQKATLHIAVTLTLVLLGTACENRREVASPSSASNTPVVTQNGDEKMVRFADGTELRAVNGENGSGSLVIAKNGEERVRTTFSDDRHGQLGVLGESGRWSTFRISLTSKGEWEAKPFEEADGGIECFFAYVSMFTALVAMRSALFTSDRFVWAAAVAAYVAAATRVISDCPNLDWYTRWNIQQSIWDVQRLVESTWPPMT